MIQKDTKIIYLDRNTPSSAEPLVATIGFFDGVHLGHQFLIHEVIEKAKASGRSSAVITMDEHPRYVLHPDQPPRLLTSLSEKINALSKTGVDKVFVLHFDTSIAALSAKVFMQKVLKDQLNVAQLLIGYDNKFGHNRQEGFKDYVIYGQELGIEVVQSKEYHNGLEHISSSIIRKHIENGEIEQANMDLGHAYSIEGRVINGYKNGRKIGFPTANLSPKSPHQLLPKGGVYAVWVTIKGYPSRYMGMMNIGFRPTLNGHELSLETNIFDFKADVYNKEMTVSLVKYVRNEIKFDGLEALKHQLEKDKTQIKAILEQDRQQE